MCLVGRGKWGGSAPGGTVQGAAFGGAKIWHSEVLHPQLSVLFTVHTNVIIVTIRITIGDLIAGVGVATGCPGWQTPSRCHWTYNVFGGTLSLTQPINL